MKHSTAALVFQKCTVLTGIEQDYVIEGTINFNRIRFVFFLI